MTHNDKSNNVKPDSSDSVIAVNEKFLAGQLLGLKWTLFYEHSLQTSCKED